MDYPANLFVVAAPSGSGKSSLVKALMELDAGVAPSISHTTRAPRGQEMDGREYFFVDRTAFDAMIEAGDFPGVKDAVEKSMAEGSCNFEEALARMIADGSISRDEGLAHADSVTNLLWRLENTSEPERKGAAAARQHGGDLVFGPHKGAGEVGIQGLLPLCQLKLLYAARCPRGAGVVEGDIEPAETR